MEGGRNSTLPAKIQEQARSGIGGHEVGRNPAKYKEIRWNHPVWYFTISEFCSKAWSKELLDLLAELTSPNWMESLLRPVVINTLSAFLEALCREERGDSTLQGRFFSCVWEVHVLGRACQFSSVQPGFANTRAKDVSVLYANFKTFCSVPGLFRRWDDQKT